MAWKAECNRRKWYCILGWDAVSWFSEHSYNEWRRSLTPAQIRKLEEYEKKQKEKREKDLENAILAELEKFILEMGSDFAFLARQKHLVLDGKKNYAILKDVLTKIK